MGSKFKESYFASFSYNVYILYAKSSKLRWRREGVEKRNKLQHSEQMLRRESK